jgi:exosome complex exonuclease DIS3/RRP44
MWPLRSALLPTDILLVVLKDDDADDDEGAGIDEGEKKKADDERMDVEDRSGGKPREVQPTGKVVGVTKRNWRA